MKLVLGFVNDSKDCLGVGMLSAHLAIKHIRASLGHDSFEVRIIGSNPLEEFPVFVSSIHPRVTCLAPSDWELLGLPSMGNGNFATYWKFDLINSLSSDEFLLYIDSDAFMVSNPNIDALCNRISIIRASNPLYQKAIATVLMVPSHRPCLERVGYHLNSNPYNYYNAGFIFANFSSKISHEEIKEVFRSFFFSDKSRLYWHDQDIINALLGSNIYPLPFRYNVGTGMLSKDYFGPANLNYLAELEIKNPVIIHASGRIYKTRQKWRFRKNVLHELNQFIDTFSDLTPFQKSSVLQLKQDLVRMRFHVSIINFSRRVLRLKQKFFRFPKRD